MRLSRFAAGILVAALLLFAISFALREAGDFERISGVTRPDAAEGEPTLRGAGGQPADPAGRVGQDLPWSEAAPSDGTSSPWVAHGRVVDLHHRPLAGVPIVGEAQRTTSDEEGRFTLRGKRGSIQMRPGEGWEGLGIATRERPELTLQVVRLLPLRVRVLDVAGRPVAGVSGTGGHSHTAAADRDGGETLVDATVTFGPTDEAGECVLRLETSTSRLQLDVSHRGAFAKEDVHFPYQREVVLRLQPRFWITGEIVDEGGRRVETNGTPVATPLDGARTTVRNEGVVWIEMDLGDGAGTEEADPVENPEKKPPRPFFLTVSGAGPWLVHFEPDEPGLADSDPVLVTAPAKNVRLVCPRAVSIRGRVLDTGAEPFIVTWLPSHGAAGRVRSPTRMRTEPDGTFHLEGLAAGPGRLLARRPDDDRYGLVENLEAPLEGVRIRLVPGTPLVGLVTDLVSPEGLEDATLQVRAVDGDLLGGAPVQTANAATPADEVGTFRIRGLPPGRYDLHWCWYGRWGGSSGRWAPFGVTVDLGPETGEVVLPAPR